MGFEQDYAKCLEEVSLSVSEDSLGTRSEMLAFQDTLKSWWNGIDGLAAWLISNLPEESAPLVVELLSPAYPDLLSAMVSLGMEDALQRCDHCLDWTGREAEGYEAEGAEADQEE